MATQHSTFMITDRFVTAALHRRTKADWYLEQAVALPVDAPRALVPETDLTGYVDPMIQLAREIQAIGDASRLLIPGTWVFAHAITRPSRRFDSLAAAYELEGYVPLPLEQLTCMFLPADAKQWLGLAVATRPLAHLLDELSRSSVHIDEIDVIPLAGCDESVKSPSDRTCDVWLDRHHVSIVVTQARGNIHTLRTVRLAGNHEPNPERVTRSLPLSTESETNPPPAIRIAGTAPRDIEVAIQTHLNAAPIDGCTSTTASIPSPKVKARGPGLRVGPLAFAGRWTQTLQHVTRTAAMLAVFLTLLAAGLHRQRSAVNEKIDAIARTERQLYTQSFPGRPIPLGIALRIASERIRLEGLTRSTNPEDTRNALPPAQTVPEELRHLIAAIPADVRLFVQDLQLDDRHLTLRGTARSHAEAERIASALRGVPGWVPSPPRSDVRRGGGVGFSLHAQRGTDEPSDQATPD